MAEREVKASEFKDQCLELMEEVARTGDTLVVTKRGRPVVRIAPAAVVAPAKSPLFGFLKHRTVTGPETQDYSVWTDEMQGEQDADLNDIRRPALATTR